MTDEARTVVYGGYTTEIVDKLTNDNVCEGCEDVCLNTEQHWV